MSETLQERLRARAKDVTQQHRELRLEAADRIDQLERDLSRTENARIGLIEEKERLERELKNLAPTGRYNGINIEGWYHRAALAESALVDERERCAKVCATNAKYWADQANDETSARSWREYCGAKGIAYAQAAIEIRALPPPRSEAEVRDTSGERTTDALLPCPLCNEIPHFFKVEGLGPDDWQVWHECGGKVRTTKANAAQEWNRRAPSPGEGEAKDTARLDWLSGPDRFVGRRQVDYVRSDPCIQRAVSFFHLGRRIEVEGETLRAAIDAAMTGHAPEKTSESNQPNVVLSASGRKEGE